MCLVESVSHFHQSIGQLQQIHPERTWGLKCKQTLEKNHYCPKTLAALKSDSSLDTFGSACKQNSCTSVIGKRMRRMRRMRRRRRRRRGGGGGG